MALKRPAPKKESETKSDNGGSNSSSRTTSTFSGYKSYDSTFSSMTFKLFGTGGIIELAPIIPDMIGKVPKKGESVYDYDSKVSIYINGDGAIELMSAIDRVQELMLDEDYAEHIKTVELDFGGPNAERKLILHVPGKTKIRVGKEPVDLSEHWLLQIVNTKDEEVIKAYHILQNKNLTFTFTKESGQEAVEDVVFTDLIAIRKFAEAIYTNCINLVRHGAAQVAGRSSGGASKPRTGFQSATMDDDDEPSESTEETSNNTEKKAPAKKSSLEEEFADDDDIPC